MRSSLSDGITPSRLPALLAMGRQEEPEVNIQLFQVPLSQQIKGLQDDLYDVGFAQSDEVGEGITAEAVWRDPLMVTGTAQKPVALTPAKRQMVPPARRSRSNLPGPSGCTAAHTLHGGDGSGQGPSLRDSDT